MLPSNYGQTSVKFHSLDWGSSVEVTLKGRDLEVGVGDSEQFVDGQSSLVLEQIFNSLNKSLRLCSDSVDHKIEVLDTDWGHPVALCKDTACQ
jgi:hypothetical protein